MKKHQNVNRKRLLGERLFENYWLINMRYFVILFIFYFVSCSKKEDRVAAPDNGGEVVAEKAKIEESQNPPSKIEYKTDKKPQGPEHLYNQAIQYRKQKKDSLAFKNFKLAAEKKHLPSIIEVSKAYYEGKGVRKNDKQGFNWKVKAAENGDSASMLSIAMNYKLVKSLKDPKKCVYWLKKASELNYPHALSNLAYCYIQGFGVDIDYRKALIFSERAVENGVNMQSTVNGLKNYFSLKKLADSGDLAAKHKIANAYRFGQGVWRDEKKAIEIMTEVANKGYKLSQKELGQYYFNNFQPDLAYSWLKKSTSDGSSNSTLKDIESERLSFKKLLLKAGAGDHNSQYRVSVYYKTGKYITRDLNKAKEWAELAAAQGNKSAITLLKKIKR